MTASRLERMAKTSKLMGKLAEALPKKQAAASKVAVGVGDGLVFKRSISLYAHDLEKLDEIKAYMASHGIRNLADSEALRLACRNVELSEAMVRVFEEMRTEDKRRKQ